jgi:hypothetical protein
MSNEIQPYRIPDTLAKTEVVPLKVGGIIRARKPPPPIKPHKCEPPGLWYRFWNWITFRPLYEGTVWRCAFCGKIRMLKDDGYRSLLSWEATRFTYWEAAGGHIPKEEVR